jgi:dTDP-4-amino-4,6-dideoxygalactose transaminase
VAVPFLDMSRMHSSLKEEFTRSFSSIVDRSAFVNGPEVKEFEASFAKWVGTAHCVGMSSGLDAEVIGLRCLGIKPGDKVIVPAMTFIATLEAVTQTGGIPVLVDVDENGLMDLDQLESQANAGARFTIPVHLYGQIVDPVRLGALIKKYNLKVLEDACQAHGASKGGVRAGQIGQVSAFSFYPGKNLGALGDGGALCTSDAEAVKLAIALREHGQTAKYMHTYEGYTARLDTMQASFLSTKLPQMDAWTVDRIRAAKYYFEKLQHVKGIKFQAAEFDGSHVYHLFVLLTDRRQALAEEFSRRSIGHGFHYPVPMHRLPCYEGQPWSKGSFPNAERFASEAISLPIFPRITVAEQDEVISAVKAIFE